MNLNCLDELVLLAAIWKHRMLRLLEENQKSNVPFSILSNAINNYRRVLLDIQKLKFDLGLEEVVIGVTRGARVTAPSVARPDDRETQKQLFEAITIANEIFRRRGITARSHRSASL